MTLKTWVISRLVWLNVGLALLVKPFSPSLCISICNVNVQICDHMLKKIKRLKNESAPK